MLSLCVSLYSDIVLLFACQHLSALCIECSVYRVLYSVCCALQLMCSTAVPTTCFSCGLYNILIWAGQFACQRHSAVCWYAIVCLEREESM